MLIYTFVVFLYINGSGIIGVLQSLSNIDIKTEKMEPAFVYYNWVKENTTIPLPYVVYAKSSLSTQIYGLYNVAVIVGSYVAIVWFTVRVVKTLKSQRNIMTAKTFALNKQINYLMLIQVSITYQCNKI